LIFNGEDMALTPAQYVILGDYIAATPALNSIPNTPDGAYEIATVLNTPSNPGYQSITAGTAMLWAAEGPRVRIGQASVDQQQPESIRASCQVFIDLISGGSTSMLRTEEAPIQALFEGWLTVGIITQQEYDAVYGQPNGLACTLIAQSVELVGQIVAWEDVYTARNM
jgi:hypothetical protein